MGAHSGQSMLLLVTSEALPSAALTPMATPNCSTYGQSNCPRQDG